MNKCIRLKSALAALAVLAACAACALILYCVDPSENHFYPRCPFFMLTGLKCPGCGLTRAMHQILHGNIVKAFRYNQFLVVALPLAIIMRLIPSCKNCVVLNRVILAAAICWWILRNID